MSAIDISKYTFNSYCTQKVEADILADKLEYLENEIDTFTSDSLFYEFTEKERTAIKNDLIKGCREILRQHRVAHNTKVGCEIEGFWRALYNCNSFCSQEEWDRRRSKIIKAKPNGTAKDWLELYNTFFND